MYVCGWLCEIQEQGIEKKVWNPKGVEIFNFFKLGFLATASLTPLEGTVYTLYKGEVTDGERKMFYPTASLALL